MIQDAIVQHFTQDNNCVDGVLLHAAVVGKSVSAVNVTKSMVFSQTTEMEIVNVTKSMVFSQTTEMEIVNVTKSLCGQYIAAMYLLSRMVLVMDWHSASVKKGN